MRTSYRLWIIWRYERLDHRAGTVIVVIDKDSFIQKNNTILLEYYDGIEKYRRQKDTLSSNKLGEVIKAYKEFHAKNEIPESRIVYLDKDEIEKLNQ